MAKQKRNEESAKALAKDTKAASSRKPSALRARETPNPKGQDMREIKPQDVTAIIDTREQSPLDVSPLQTAVEVLDTGDYSAKGLETVVRIERKSLPDLVACVGRERDRFEREVARLLAYPMRILVVEATWEQVESHSQVSPQWRGQVTSSQVVGSLLGWQAAGLSVHMVGNHERAGSHVARLLFMAARRRWRELRSLAASFKEDTRK